MKNKYGPFGAYIVYADRIIDTVRELNRLENEENKEYADFESVENIEKYEQKIKELKYTIESLEEFLKNDKLQNRQKFSRL